MTSKAMQPDRFYFEESKKLWEEFRVLLETGHGPIEPNSKLISIADDVIGIYEVYLDKSKFDPKQDYRSRWRKMTGLNDFVRKIMRSYKLPEFENVWPLAVHFLNENSEIVQNDSTPSVMNRRTSYSSSIWHSCCFVLHRMLGSTSATEKKENIPT